MKAGETILRFGVTERLYHWVQALPFLALLATGGLLLGQRLAGRELVGTALLVRIHLASGCALPVGILLVVVGGDRRTLLANARRALRWGPADLAWFVLQPLSGLRRGIRVPPSGKFNPGQKLNLLAQMVLLPIFLATGIAIWLAPGALLPWYVHVASFLAAMPLVAGHVYLAVIHPTTRKGLSGVFTGRVDGRWAREHYELEYGRNQEEP